MTYHSHQGVPRDVAETCLSLGKEMESMMAGDVDGFDDKMRPLLRIMCAEVARQKRRLGGDFAVAHAVVSRYIQGWTKISLPGSVNIR